MFTVEEKFKSLDKRRGFLHLGSHSRAFSLLVAKTLFTLFQLAAIPHTGLTCDGS
jgi:hypothetical protein